MDREEYEAKKKVEATRQQEKRESAESDARARRAKRRAARREARLARIWFFCHPDKIVRYTGYLQLFTGVLAIATAALVCATIYTAIVLHNTDDKIGEQVSALRRQLTMMENAERPSLHIGEAKLVRNKPHDPNPEVAFKFINSGKSAAILRASNINCRIFENPPPTPSYEAITKTARNVLTSGAIFGSDILGQCKFASPITEFDWIEIDAGRKVILFYGTVKYEGPLNIVYTNHFALVIIRDNPNGSFGDFNRAAYNYEEIDRLE